MVCAEFKPTEHESHHVKSKKCIADNHFGTHFPSTDLENFRDIMLKICNANVFPSYMCTCSIVLKLNNNWFTLYMY